MNNKINKKQIILDTNFLLLPFTLKIDIFSEINKIVFFPYEFVVLEQSIDELNKIASNKNEKGKDREAAKLAIKLIKQKQEKNELKIINFIKDKQKTLYKAINSRNLLVDDIILMLASSQEDKEIKEIQDKKKIRENFIVATNDAILKKKLKNLGIKIIYLKKKKVMEMQNVL
ncbi:MAG: hypothetical protein QW757_03510 [Candidatus Woesearchaeota archaeon]